MITIADTDALLGIINKDDIHHKAANSLLAKLSKHEATVLILSTTLAEFSLLASSRVGFERAREAVSEINHYYSIIGADEDLTKQALELFMKQTSKEESLFDCFVMAAAKRFQADAIFSFDKGYIKPKNNFKLAGDLL